MDECIIFISGLFGLEMNRQYEQQLEEVASMYCYNKKYITKVHKATQRDVDRSPVFLNPPIQPWLLAR